MKNLRSKIAVITGGGTGMGRELARQLSAEGCHVAMCDVSVENMTETRRLCLEKAPAGTRVSIHECDVSEEAQMLAFRDAVLREHDTDQVNLLFNNAGIGGGGSFLVDDRDEWEKTFDVCFRGVYYGARAFMPLLVASPEACIVNTSSVNGFWASLGPEIPHTAYSAAKFAVKGFTEALINDCRMNAPHVKVALVMPGHVGTSIALNSGKVLGRGEPKEMPAEDVARIRERLVDRNLLSGNESDDEIRAAMQAQAIAFRDDAPVSAAEAATIILDGVREDRWRILVGEDAAELDRMVRADPESAYEASFMQRLNAEGHLNLELDGS